MGVTAVVHQLVVRYLPVLVRRQGFASRVLGGLRPDHGRPARWPLGPVSKSEGRVRRGRGVCLRQPRAVRTARG